MDGYLRYRYLPRSRKKILKSPDFTDKLIRERSLWLFHGWGVNGNPKIPRTQNLPPPPRQPHTMFLPPPKLCTEIPPPSLLLNPLLLAPKICPPPSICLHWNFCPPLLFPPPPTHKIMTAPVNQHMSGPSGQGQGLVEVVINYIGNPRKEKLECEISFMQTLRPGPGPSRSSRVFVGRVE